MRFWQEYHRSDCKPFPLNRIKRYMMLICLITGDFHLDHLVTVVSAMYLGKILAWLVAFLARTIGWRVKNTGSNIVHLKTRQMISSDCQLALFFLFWPRYLACGISSLIRDWTWTIAVKVLSPNHWTAREFPVIGSWWVDRCYWYSSTVVSLLEASVLNLMWLKN